MRYNNAELCTDNRYEMIGKYKKALIESTNIEDSSEEMKVIDNVLFRFWQMGWLEKLETTDVDQVVRCKDCKRLDKNQCCTKLPLFIGENTTFYCALGKRRKDAEVQK